MFNLLPYNEVNEQFSNENGNPGILLAKATFKMHQKNVLVHALFRDPLAHDLLVIARIFTGGHDENAQRILYL